MYPCTHALSAVSAATLELASRLTIGSPQTSTNGSDLFVAAASLRGGVVFGVQLAAVRLERVAARAVAVAYRVHDAAAASAPPLDPSASTTPSSSSSDPDWVLAGELFEAAAAAARLLFETGILHDFSYAAVKRLLKRKDKASSVTACPPTCDCSFCVEGDIVSAAFKSLLVLPTDPPVPAA